MDAPQTALVAQLQTKGGQSKKFVIVAWGLGCVMIIFFASIVAMMMKPEIAVNISPLASIVVPSIAGLIGIYAGSQAYAEGKTTDALKQS